MPFLDKLDVVPENVENALLRKLPLHVQTACNWGNADKAFLNGLVRIFRPKKVLEIGVFHGASTCLLLNALHDMPQTTLTSIDNGTGPKSLGFDVGDIAKKVYGNDPRWTLIADKDPIEVKHTVGMYDFVLLDTLHIHPVESLNFLTILPHLAPEAVVVLHDINLFSFIPNDKFNTNVKTNAPPFPKTPLACKLLYDTVTARKLEPAIPGRANVGAFQLLPYSKDHIADVFSILSFPWGVMPEHGDRFIDFFSRHYPENCQRLFLHALQQARTMHWENDSLRLLPISRSHSSAIDSCFQQILQKKHFILYGAGGNAGHLIDYLRTLELRVPDAIWDKNHAAISNCKGIPVVAPDFDSMNDADFGIIVTNAALDVASDIDQKLTDHSINSWMNLNVWWAVAGLLDIDIHECCRQSRIQEWALAHLTDRWLKLRAHGIDW